MEGLIAKPMRHTSDAHRSTAAAGIVQSDCLYEVAWQASTPQAEDVSVNRQRLSITLGSSGVTGIASALAALQSVASDATGVSLHGLNGSSQGWRSTAGRAASDTSSLWGLLRSYAQESSAPINGLAVDRNAYNPVGRVVGPALRLIDRNTEQRRDVYGARMEGGAFQRAVLLPSKISSTPGVQL